MIYSESSNKVHCGKWEFNVEEKGSGIESNSGEILCQLPHTLYNNIDFVEFFI